MGKICINNMCIKFPTIILLIIILAIIYHYMAKKRHHMGKKCHHMGKKHKVEFDETATVIEYDTHSAPLMVNALDRIYNPLRFPYRSPDFYQTPVIMPDCGRRNIPCDPGLPTPSLMPVNISSGNIAPVNISTRGPMGVPQQIGVLYKINGDKNDMHPLYGRRKYSGSNEWEYYTALGDYGLKLPVRLINGKKDEISTNDEVYIENVNTPYRATVYEMDSPMYIPYV